MVRTGKVFSRTAVVAAAEQVALARRGAQTTRIGFGEDVHGFGPGEGLMLGGISIADAPRLYGHSDGDVVLHAVATAVLSAAGLGDLGRLFPASDRATVTVELHADESMDINNLATVTSDTPDPDTSNNQDEDHITVAAEADLALTLTASPNPATAGEPLTYDLVGEERAAPMSKVGDAVLQELERMLKA